jgi:hypothetical protein
MNPIRTPLRPRSQSKTTAKTELSEEANDHRAVAVVEQNYDKKRGELTA